jgi:hypothetical protein
MFPADFGDQRLQTQYPLRCLKSFVHASFQVTTEA